MQIESRNQNQTKLPVVSINPKEGTVTLLVGEKQVQVTLPKGVLTSDWGSLLDYMERNLDENQPIERDTKNLFRALLPTLVDSSLPKAEAERIANQLFQKLLECTRTDLSELPIRFQQALTQSLPSVQLERPLFQSVQDLLSSLATNDFKAAAPIITTIPSATVVPPPSTKDLQALTRLLQPLQELEAWGAPQELSPQIIHNAKLATESTLAIPLTPQVKSQLVQAVASQPASIQQEFPVRILAVSRESLDIQILHADQSTAGSPIRIALSEQSVWPALLKANTTITMSQVPAKAGMTSVAGVTSVAEMTSTTGLTLTSSIRDIGTGVATPLMSTPPRDLGAGLSLLPHPDAAYIPVEEISDYITSKAPFTANLVDAREFISQYIPGAPQPALVNQFAQTLHNIDLQLPHGEALNPEQKELALRWMLTNGIQAKDAPELQSLFRYRSEGNREGELFSKLPQEQKEWLHKEIEKLGPKPLLAKDLAEIISHMPGKPAEKEVAQQLQSQAQWTQKDQDTRHPDDRQQVFYFMQEGMLQKGRIQVRQEGEAKQRKPGEDKPLRFYVETKTPILGEVHVDFVVQKGVLTLDFSDSKGKAEQAVQAERPLLTEELKSVGLELGQLAYRILKNMDHPSKNQAPRTRGFSGLLDLRA